MIGLLASAAAIASYNCEVAHPQLIGIEGSSAKLMPLQLTAEAEQRKFTITLTEGEPTLARVSWPSDPIQASGEFPALSTGQGAYAFSTISQGPCLFTETACLSQVNLIDTSETSAKVVISPVAFSTDRNANIRSPMIVIIQGTCSRAGAKK